MVEARRRIYSDPSTNASLRAVATAYFTRDEVRAQLVGEDALRAPTLLYWGENNPTPPAVAAYAATLVPNARYYCAARTGHWAQFEHADEHNREVLRFLSEPTVARDPVSS
jgi:2-hydroxy-6-oxonona-2,4-dienedioate hydrolase